MLLTRNRIVVVRFFKKKKKILIFCFLLSKYKTLRAIFTFMLHHKKKIPNHL
jgi:hypothetical protein